MPSETDQIGIILRVDGDRFYCEKKTCQFTENQSEADILTDAEAERIRRILVDRALKGHQNIGAAGISTLNSEHVSSKAVWITLILGATST